MKIFLLFALALLLIPIHAKETATLKIAVASNFINTARDLVAEYKKYSDLDIILSSGSTGKLTTQIRFGAPFDVFLSADEAHSERLISEGHGIDATKITYAIGQLVLISRQKASSPTSVFTSKAPLQLAMANPKIAPYGAAAQAWLTWQEIDTSRHTLVIGENINQAWHYFINGGADVALVGLSQVLQQPKLEFTYWLLDTKPVEIRQSAVVLKQTNLKAEALNFISFIQSAPATRIIKDAGYNLPE